MKNKRFLVPLAASLAVNGWLAVERRPMLAKENNCAPAEAALVKANARAKYWHDYLYKDMKVDAESSRVLAQLLRYWSQGFHVRCDDEFCAKAVNDMFDMAHRSDAEAKAEETQIRKFGEELQ
jgi:hypothetical protein